MKKLLFALLLLLAPSAAHAACTLPYQIIPQTLADANKVQADFVALLNCVNSVSITATSPIVVTPDPITTAGDISVVIPSANLLGGNGSDFTFVTVGSQLLLSAGTLSAPLATSSTFGTVKPDNSTITINAGVLTANVTGCAVGADTGVLWSNGAACSEDVTHFYWDHTKGILNLLGQTPFPTGYRVLNVSGADDGNELGSIGIAATAADFALDRAAAIGVANNPTGAGRSKMYFKLRDAVGTGMDLDIGDDYLSGNTRVGINGLVQTPGFGDVGATFQVFTDASNAPWWVLEAFTSGGNGMGGLRRIQGSGAGNYNTMGLWLFDGDNSGAGFQTEINGGTLSYFNKPLLVGAKTTAISAPLVVHGTPAFDGLPACNVGNNALQTDANGQLTCVTLSSLGTVTSVALGVPAASLFGVTGSPVTTTGTLGLTTTGTSGGIPYFNSTSTLNSSAALTQHAPMVGGGAGAPPKTLAALTNGQLLIGSTGADPTEAALTAGNGVRVTNGAGTITLAANDGYSIGWLSAINPNNAVISVVDTNSTVNAIIGAVETATGGAATVKVYKAPSGTACSAGTVLHSGSFDANGTAATNQTLTVTTPSVSAGDRLCLQTTGTTSWTGGTGIGTITVFLSPS